MAAADSIRNIVRRRRPFQPSWAYNAEPKLTETAAQPTAGGKNKYGDTLVGRMAKNTTPRRTAFGQAMNVAGRRRGLTYQVGRTADGREVHIYSNGERIVMNRKLS